MERRVRSIAPGGTTEIWDEFFSVDEDARVRYPLRVLLVFDRPSRERAVREYLIALWALSTHSTEGISAEDLELLRMLGLPPGSSREEVRSAFRSLARELHPDLGGDEELVRRLIDRYHRSAYARRRSP
jgi:hypothetical protein